MPGVYHPCLGFTRQGGRKGSIGQSARHQGGTREAGKNHLDSLGRHQGGRKGAGFCLTFNTISMANGPVRGKSWGGLHGRLPSTDWKGPFGQPERHQKGRKGSIGQSARHQGGTREAGKNHLDSLGGTREAGKNQLDSLEAPGRQERINWTACEAPGRHQGGRKEPFGQPGRDQGGTRETCSTGLPIEFRFWKGAGFCLNV